MKIILAFDAFKGSLTADEAVDAARAGVLSSQPNAQVISIPLADGGEGTAQVLARFHQAEWVQCPAHDPLLRPIMTQYAVSRDGHTAIMEMAAAAGLTLLSPSERNPMQTSTLGVGEMLMDAIARGCRRIMIGIGGSATCDGGMGVLTALGAQFADTKGHILSSIGSNLIHIATIDWSHLTQLQDVDIEVICDVSNPLYGPTGAAHVYAPQKGASATEVQALDCGLRHFATLTGRDGNVPGCGAAGGLGYGLLLLGAHLRRGIDVLLDAADIDRHLADADLVITGEGKIDSQTLNGKLPYGVLRRAQAHNTPVIALAGAVEDRERLLQAGFCAIHSITPEGMALSVAMQRQVAMQNLAKTASRTVQNCSTKP